MPTGSFPQCQRRLRQPGAGRAGDPLRLDLDPIAHRFAAGSRIRVSIAGGSHPRFARNPGTGEPVWSASRLLRATHEIGPGSRLILPVPE
ncbi:MAG: CocE/NonD family hydrolase C-terminal non-catalytic domain-containing protein [Mycobacterium sp.]|nr:CocE/NonD family hydrolase C-terminal non-catalytic domain-containing protein [Mycobacterium sp.]